MKRSLVCKWCLCKAENLLWSSYAFKENLGWLNPRDFRSWFHLKLITKKFLYVAHYVFHFYWQISVYLWNLYVSCFCCLLCVLFCTLSAVSTFVLLQKNMFSWSYNLFSEGCPFSRDLRRFLRRAFFLAWISHFKEYGNCLQVASNFLIFMDQLPFTFQTFILHVSSFCCMHALLCKWKVWRTSDLIWCQHTLQTRYINCKNRENQTLYRSFTLPRVKYIHHSNSWSSLTT